MHASVLAEREHAVRRRRRQREEGEGRGGANRGALPDVREGQKVEVEEWAQPGQAVCDDVTIGYITRQTHAVCKTTTLSFYNNNLKKSPIVQGILQQPKGSTGHWN